MINFILLNLCQDNLSSHLVSSQGGKWWWNLKFQLAIISPDLERSQIMKLNINYKRSFGFNLNAILTTNCIDPS